VDEFVIVTTLETPGTSSHHTDDGQVIAEDLSAPPCVMVLFLKSTVTAPPPSRPVKVRVSVGLGVVREILTVAEGVPTTMTGPLPAFPEVVNVCEVAVVREVTAE
jgi:hypothetical protein